MYVARRTNKFSIYIYIFPFTEIAATAWHKSPKDLASVCASVFIRGDSSNTERKNKYKKSSTAMVDDDDIDDNKERSKRNENNIEATIGEKKEKRTHTHTRKN